MNLGTESCNECQQRRVGVELIGRTHTCHELEYGVLRILEETNNLL